MSVSKKNGKLYFEVNAVNSYDVSVYIIYEASTSAGLNDAIVSRPATKYIRNGQLIIQQDNREYDIQGSVIK
ncbi:MAG: hypothetical protein IIU55_00450 [Paludibacteraceae bacterium]|nr:hypothetical protein [Paludibacteraceae bacterium]